jgi:hypothetical protein
MSPNALFRSSMAIHFVLQSNSNAECLSTHRATAQPRYSYTASANSCWRCRPVPPSVAGYRVHVISFRPLGKGSGTNAGLKQADSMRGGELDAKGRLASTPPKCPTGPKFAKGQFSEPYRSVADREEIVPFLDTFRARKKFAGFPEALSEYKENRQGPRISMRDEKITLSVVSDNGTQPAGRKSIATDVFVAFGRRPRLLDLFCCAGGAGTGYSRAASLTRSALTS